MITKVDFLSFSLYHEENHFENDRFAIVSAMDIVRQRLGDALDQAAGQGGWTNGGGRKPHSVSRWAADNGIAVFANAKLPHFLVEISGRGCEALRQVGQLENVLIEIANRVTRIDIACDMECDTDPQAFANRRDKGRFKSAGLERSATGTTVYVGARKSNRWAKVYRYNEPHPRHLLLRAEHTFKGEDGKAAADYLIANGYDCMAQQCGAIWGWKHPSWDLAPATATELTAHRADRNDSKTVYWVYDTIGPLLARLSNEGSLSLADFFEKAVSPHLVSLE